MLGDAATEEILAAWGEAYWFLADVLIGPRGAASTRPARGRTGRLDRLARFHRGETTPESEIIRSFILVPADGGAVLRHRPGQYLTFALDVPGAGHLKRNYSISSAPERPSLPHHASSGRRGPACRRALPRTGCTITPDRARVLRVAPPAGEFFLDETATGRSCCSAAASG